MTSYAEKFGKIFEGHPDFWFFVQAGAAGLVSNTLCHPIDTIKTRMFQIGGNGKYRYAGLADVISSGMRSEGIRGFWQGYRVVLLTCVPLTCVYFSAYELSERALLHARARVELMQGGDGVAKRRDQSMIDGCLVGVMAQLLSGVFFTPVDVLKERLQAYHAISDRCGALSLARRMIERGGIRSLWRGYWAGIWLWAPYGAIYLSAYRRVKESFSDRFFALLLTSGGCAALAAFLTNGVDVLKVNLQLGMAEGGGGRRRAWLTMLRTLFRQDAFFFFRGAAARVAYLSPRTAISFAIYDFFDRRHTRSLEKI